MKNKVAFAICVVLFLLATTRSEGKFMKHEKGIKLKKRLFHPCDRAPKDTVIHTVDGDIVCLSRNDEELEKQLESTGGYNRRYVAATLEEAKDNFKNMFQVYGKRYQNTADWQRWRYSDPSHISIKKNPRATAIDSSFVQKMRKSRKRRRNRRSNDDLEITKRASTGMTIQCLPGGRETEKGIHLCPSCQRCTELPENFFPRYLNELTCDNSTHGNSSQTACYLNSEYQIGTCQQIKMTMDLLVHKNGKYAVEFKNQTMTKYKAIYEPYTHEIRIFCECLVFSSMAG